jgi:hypothetical protein
VHGQELVEPLGADEVLVRLEELRADEERLDPARGEEDQ